MPSHRTRPQLAILAVAIVTAASVVIGAAEEEEPPKLLGRVHAENLDQEPYDEWFRSGYDEYEPNPKILAELRGADLEGLKISVFFGTWCGDSRREVPRMLKLFDAMGLSDEQVALIAVDSIDEALKRAPGGEERGLEIYRVPTAIVMRDGHETNRLVEHPVLSLERDFLEILDDCGYEPSYASYPVIRGWLADGLLSDENVSARGLANQIKHVVSGEGEVAAAARVLMTRGDVPESIKLFEVNCSLYRESARSWTRLADAWLLAGSAEEAREAAERALRLNDDEEQVEELLELIDRTREVGVAGDDG
jgi:tetratricopeptide (TPR) repeat protein